MWQNPNYVGEPNNLGSFETNRQKAFERESNAFMTSDLYSSQDVRSDSEYDYSKKRPRHDIIGPTSNVTSIIRGQHINTIIDTGSVTSLITNRFVEAYFSKDEIKSME